MIKSKYLKNVVAIWLLVLLSFTALAEAEISPKSTNDELLQILPAESLFCVRVNNLDTAISSMDQFLSGILPQSSEVSMLVRMQFAKILGSAELNGVNMGGNFAIFGPILNTDLSDPDNIAILVPVTDYNQFVSGNPNVGQPDEKGISKIISDGVHPLLVTQVKGYALISPQGNDNELIVTAKSISEGNSTGLESVLDAAEAQEAIKEPLWMYGNIQQVSKTFGPLLSGQLEQMKQMMKGIESEEQMSMGPSVKSIETYISILETLMNETKSLSLTVRPRPNVCNLTFSVSAVSGTEMANMLAADTSIVKENRLLGYLEDGAMMNFAGNMNAPLWKQLNLKSIDLLTAFAGEAMTAEDITKMKTMVTDMLSSLGGPVAFSFFIDANSKPPFAFKYILEVKDADKFNNVLEEASEMMNVGGIADFYKSLGLEMGFTVKRGIDSYRGVSIDSVKFVMRSTDPNSPQGQMIDALYDDGFEYKLAIVDGLCVFAVGGDLDSAIHKLIDEVKAGGPRQMAAEMKAALTLLPEAGGADFMGTYNFLRLFKMAGAMAGAFMPVPMPMTQIDIPTKSNIVFAGKASNGKITMDIALPKEHLMEMMGMFQMIMPEKRAMPQQETIQQGPIFGVIREDEDRMGTVTDRQGNVIYGSDIRYSPMQQQKQIQEQSIIDRARVTITKGNLMILHSVVIQFKMDTGRFPTEEEGLNALIEQPADVKGAWKVGGYLDNTKILKDGWGNDFTYDLYPESGKQFVIISFGADGKEGGEGYETDLFSTDPYTTDAKATK
ncbi:MAG: hypothetical protein GWN67_28185 [Phycisphaerae bacterium]|nr:hypothetical protein [Phycisphaerae bacterium]NIT60372.1 hypothetical protein [Fodinibius sp.]NIS54880.1 hypothetical protein [Phycisphaerae bacterium]NIU12407.1 hypothetical protein [Phycisphaerae bacterium]NIU60100.1 hypothetical protein [Phycisphaerae bacterium]